MVSFLDGPAAGVALPLYRSPQILRVVQSPGGKWDALDQLTDTPEPREKIFLYRMTAHRGSVHVSCRPRSKSFTSQIAEYRFAQFQPADETMRVAAKWVAFAQELQNTEKLGDAMRSGQLFTADQLQQKDPSCR